MSVRADVRSPIKSRSEPQYCSRLVLCQLRYITDFGHFYTLIKHTCQTSQTVSNTPVTQHQRVWNVIIFSLWKQPERLTNSFCGSKIRTVFFPSVKIFAHSSPTVGNKTDLFQLKHLKYRPQLNLKSLLITADTGVASYDFKSQRGSRTEILF